MYSEAKQNIARTFTGLLHDFIFPPSRSEHTRGGSVVYMSLSSVVYVGLRAVQTSSDVEVHRRADDVRSLEGKNLDRGDGRLRR